MGGIAPAELAGGFPRLHVIGVLALGLRVASCEQALLVLVVRAFSFQPSVS